jgi:hypothetical protein
MKILKQLSAGLLGIAFLIELAGCASQSSDTLAIVAGANAQRLRAKYGDTQKLADCIGAAQNSPKMRNILLNDLILIIDLHYYSWEKHLYDKKAGFDLGADAVLLGLGGATALAGTTELANILGQISTGITGVRSSVDSDLLQKNSIPAIVAKMRAGRATQLAKMQKAMSETGTNGKALRPSPVSQYSVQQGLIDLNTYYAAGTFVGALQDITAKAAEEKDSADRTIEKLKPGASPPPKQ